jgi:hypothetical protein
MDVYAEMDPMHSILVMIFSELRPRPYAAHHHEWLPRIYGKLSTAIEDN